MGRLLSAFSPKTTAHEPHRASPQMLIYTGGEVFGDGVIKLPFLAALREEFPDTRICWFARSETVYQGPLREMAAPLIDEIVTRPRGRRSFLDIFGLWRRRFDVIIDTQLNLSTTLLLKTIPHARFISAAAGYALSTTKPPREMQSAQSLRGQLTALATAAADRLLALPALDVEAQWHARAAELLPDGPSYVGFVPGARDRSHCWPLAHFIGLARMQARAGRVPVFILGPDEQDWTAMLRGRVPQALFPLSQAGDTGALFERPEMTVALGARLTIAIANDTGAAHMLAAGGSPMVTLYRSRHKKVKFSPPGDHIVSLAPEDFGATKIAAIPPDAVLGAIERLVHRAIRLPDRRAARIA